jgi:hypothetical protein
LIYFINSIVKPFVNACLLNSKKVKYTPGVASQFCAGRLLLLKKAQGVCLLPGMPIQQTSDIRDF